MELKIDKKLDSTKGIPSDWSIESIRKLGEIKTGPFGTLLKADEYSRGSGVPLISVREIRKGYLQVDENTPLVPLSVRRRLPEYILEKGDIVFGRKGAVDRSAMVKEDQAGWFLGSDGIRIRPYNSNYSEFIAYQFQRQDIQAWLLQHATGTTMATLSQDILSRVSIPIATIPEQRAIATALSDVDSLIVALDKLIAKKRAIKTATMQQLLTGKQRLPGFNDAWEEKLLGELGCFSKGRGIRKSDLVENGIPCVRYGELYTHHRNVIKSFGSFIPPQVAPSSQRLKQDDILFAGSGETKEEIGICAAFIDIVEAYAGGDIIIFSPGEQDSIFLSYLLNAPHIADQKASMGQGDAVVHISSRHLAQLKILLPTILEQKAIAKVLSDMEAEIEALEARRDKTKQIKQGMMQELLTGKTRLV